MPTLNQSGFKYSTPAFGTSAYAAQWIAGGAFDGGFGWRHKDQFKGARPKGDEFHFLLYAVSDAGGYSYHDIRKAVGHMCPEGYKPTTLQELTLLALAIKRHEKPLPARSHVICYGSVHIPAGTTNTSAGNKFTACASHLRKNPSRLRPVGLNDPHPMGSPLYIAFTKK